MDIAQVFVLLGFVVAPSLLTVVSSRSYPSSVLVTSTSITDVPLSCTGPAPVQWRVNGTVFNPGNPLPGLSFVVESNSSIITQTLTVRRAFVLNYNGTIFQCSTNGEDFSSVPTAFVTVYSKQLLTLTRACVIDVLQILPQSQWVYHQSYHQLVY